MSSKKFNPFKDLQSDKYREVLLKYSLLIIITHVGMPISWIWHPLRKWLTDSGFKQPALTVISLITGLQDYSFVVTFILGDPGADSGGEGKSKQAEKYSTKKSKERREDPLGTMSYQTSSKRSPLFCLLIGQKNNQKSPIRSQNGGDRLELVW